MCVYIYIYIYIISKNLLYSTRNSPQYSVMAYKGKKSKKEWTFV